MSKFLRIVNRLLFAGLLIFFFIILQGASCSDDSTNPDDKENWKLNSKTDYSVSSTQKTEIVDTISGFTILFPNGGSGTLTVAEVDEGPSIEGFQTKRFYLNFSGSEKVQLKLKYDKNSITNLYYYGLIEGAAIEKSEGNKGWWNLIEKDTTNGYLLYEVNLKPESGLAWNPKKPYEQVYTPPNSNYFAISTFVAGSNEWNAAVNYKQTANQVIELWLNNMSDAMETNCRKLINGNLKFDVRIASTNYYQAFDNLLFGKNALICLKMNNMTGNEGLHAIAHEVGHYMNHVMCGYTRYMEIYARIPKEYWGLGGSIEHAMGLYLEGRVYVLEEYAFFSEVLATGNVNVDMLGVNPPTLCDQIDPPRDASRKDYPSHEGYGMFVIGALMRDASQNQVALFSYLPGQGDRREYARVPSINAPLCDIIGYIWQKGPRDINELIKLVNDYVATLDNDNKYKLPAMLEPLGWSYNGAGLITDENDKPLEKCAVQNISQVGGSSKIDEYRTPLSAYTGKDGKFLLKRMYPGNSILRVFYNFKDGRYKDSTDFPVTINWENPTNKQIDLKTFKISQSNILETIKKCKNISMTFDAKCKWSSGDEDYLMSGDGSGVDLWNDGFGEHRNDVIWSGQKMTWNYTVNGSQSIILNFSNDGTITSGEAIYKDQHGWEYSIKFKDLKFNYSYTEDNIAFHWQYSGSSNDMSKYLVSLTANEPTYGEMKSYDIKTVEIYIELRNY